ncbi:MAG TPA: apolipoprotein N-acyltransferase [Thermoanaerobaculia bacterium]|nr:apolipoprotein N-acyltransferase [Thermoanaerobaculia bacterium]
MWGACFQTTPRPLLALVALLPLLLLLLRPSREPLALWRVRSAPRCLALGWLHGIGAWLVAVPWIAGVLREHGGLSGWLSVLLLIALCAYLGAYHAAFALFARRMIARASPAWIALALPAGWVGLEWVRSVLLTGFPWNLAAYAWVAVPGALSASAWVGSFGISFLLVQSQVAWFSSLRAGSIRPLWALAPTLLLLVAGVATTPPPAPPPDDGHPVWIVQPDIEIEESGPASLGRMMAMSECPQPGGLVVWPESATWPRSWQGDVALRSAVLDLAEAGCQVLINTSRWEGDDAYNTAMVIGRQGEIAHYDKIHLVPFGEYVPLAGLFPFLDEIARNAGGYSAASELVVLPWNEETLGVAICFEITLPAQVARLAQLGATVLVTLTNDSWYGDTSAPRQHFVSARFRAAENRRPLLRAAITGISAVIDPWGRPLDKLGVDQAGVIERRVAGRSAPTLYTRAPWAVPALAGVLGLIGLARPRPTRRSGEPTSPEEAS